MIPTSDGGFALGSATKQWSDLYVRDSFTLVELDYSQMHKVTLQ